MMGSLFNRPHFLSPAISLHLRRMICKCASTSTDYGYGRSYRAYKSLPIQLSSPLMSFGQRWHRPNRYLGTASSLNGNTPPSPDISSPSKQMYVWEQTISSSAANASSDSSSADEKTTHGGKGRILYRSVNHDQNQASIGWEVMTTKKETDFETTKSSLSSISSAIKSYRNKGLANVQNLPFMHHFLPAHYPHSVCPSYSTYASYCFMGSIAGSSAMVLSTQALLVAVGVGTQSAAPMAAALNWVMKDGVGQLGGVIFASQLGKGGIDFDYWRGKFGKLTESLGGGGRNKTTKEKRRGNFQRGTADTNPKRWRMVAALALDLSTLLEICTPLVGPEWFLPCASVANVGKNVGFLAASASRAAIHMSLSQGGSSIIPVASNASPEEASESSSPTKPKGISAARSSNLGDVTAKSGSQAIVASLLGTAIGIFLSRTFCSDYGTVGILAGFVILSAVHQLCTYKAVKVVPLRSLDRHRLHIVLTSYIAENHDRMIRCNRHSNDDRVNFASLGTSDEGRGKTLTPSQVAEKESFLPVLSPDDSVHWLTVGSSLIDICPSGVAELEGLLLRRASDDKSSTKCTDIGTPDQFDPELYEKYILKIHLPSSATSKSGGMAQLTFFEGASDDDILRGMFHAYTAHAFMKDGGANDSSNSDVYTANQILSETQSIMISQEPTFVEHLGQVGWQMGTGYVNVECGSSHRLKIQNVDLN